ncbi:type I-F CRISPR-associated protein Csy1 [uncultured Desulfuromusa sp.]|uniref:type I-F CRISPR-associated protein Csy1 n=1 Tax=uncultured Desulfuromusa sp. TaxID=219183 RepID=UPI002AA63D75|nr:type I-F CRISPR-associated protein Csy1 [uncultured Desulfuromusa sp.]
MNEEIQRLETWNDVIVDFIKERKEQKIIDLLSKKDTKIKPDDEKQAINIQLEEVLKNEKINEKDIKEIVDTKNVGKNKIKKFDFVLNQYKKLMNLSPELKSVSDISRRYDERRKMIEDDHEPKYWLDMYAKYAKGVSFATHVAKLTHSSIKGASSFFVQPDVENSVPYLSTSNLSNPIIDSAIDNAAYTPVVNLLKLELNGKSIATLLSANDSLPFQNLTSDKEQLGHWVKEFSAALSAPNLASHSLAKQIYFPISTRPFSYHLLCILNSSTMAHRVFESFSKNKDEAQNKFFDKNKFHKSEVIRYPGRATLALTSMDSAKNVSPLHSKRGGKLHLFPTRPPTWQTQLKPPIYRKSLFDDFYNSSIHAELDYLRDFLLRFKQLDLSIKDPRRMRHLERWVNNLIDEFLFYVSTIQSLQSGWSIQEGIMLKREHQYLLDPYRMDEAFQSARQGGDWQAVIRADFALWLNRQLRSKDNQFTPQKEHTQLWKKLLEVPLRELMEPIEIELKQQARWSV